MTTEFEKINNILLSTFIGVILALSLTNYLDLPLTRIVNKK
jgi:hypothetical protein